MKISVTYMISGYTCQEEPGACECKEENTENCSHTQIQIIAYKNSEFMTLFVAAYVAIHTLTPGGTTVPVQPCRIVARRITCILLKEKCVNMNILVL